MTPLEFTWRVSEASREGREALAALDIDHDVPPVDDKRGGSVTARTELKKFIEQRLASYHLDEIILNETEEAVFHHGFISVIFLHSKSSMKC